MQKNIFLILFLGFLFSGCERADSTSANSDLPNIITSPAINISSSGATCGGTITYDGNEGITSFGICWGATPMPIIADFHSVHSGNMAAFDYAIQGLTKNQTYYVRAYATNSLGTHYGNQISFMTSATEQVYISGISNGRSVYWKDGVLNALTPSGSSNFALGSAIAVSNNDIYVAGYELSSGSYEAKIWKNGIGTTLGTPQSFARAIAVANDDVYVVGTEIPVGSSLAKLWKNGVGTNLSSTGKPGSVVVVDNTVYVGGIEESGGSRAGIIWINGTPTRLYGLCYPNASATCTYDWTTINDIFVAGGDVYAVGTSINTGLFDNILWKNGIATPITINPSSVFIKNNDIYIAGTVGNMASIWKNGTITSLTDGSNQAFANSVYVLGDDVYVVGSERIPGSPNTVAKCWKNGVVLNLSDGTVPAEATDIFVQ